MRILITHNSYQQAGGEDTVVANETALLKAHGHDVYSHSVSNHIIQSRFQKVATALQVHYSRWGQREAARAIQQTMPDIVHVHNFFPLLTPAIYDACRDAGVPVIQTLHNYRTICAGGLLMRAGRPCEDCVTGSPYQAVLHSCYRGSRLGSLTVARMVAFHRKHRTWSTKVDRFISLTKFAKKKFIDAGFPEKLIVVKPNFTMGNNIDVEERTVRTGALFVGRLSAEKGIGTLLKAFSAIDVRLRVVGDGPLLDDVANLAAANPQIESLGHLSSQRVSLEMAEAGFLIFPSEWYEGFPMTIVEAFSAGLPVIASRLGGMAELIADGVTGLHFNSGDEKDLADKVRWAADNPGEMLRMGRNARLVYEDKYTPEKNYQQLMAVYRDVIEKKNRK
jgi:glycosyltransferase involved in cell wall biosynthesis